MSSRRSTRPPRRYRSPRYSASEILGVLAVVVLVSGIVGVGVYRLLIGLSW